MRYQNWDVLLFPGDSRTPIQEFDTKCFALEQNERVPPSEDGRIDIDPKSFESMTLVPVLTSFVSSLERGAEFRVSIHHWDKPQPSRLLFTYKTPDEAVLFESRVYIDGMLVAQHTFDEEMIWPEVIGDPGCFQSTEDIFLVADDAERGDVPLRFPPFHKEILQQPHWEPGESVGRIKVIISEGVLRGTSPPATSHPKFDRLRDVIAFSFQHAPQNILEYSGIAWPNMRIFGKQLPKSSRPGPIGSRLPPIPGYEAHSHSPKRPPIASRSKRLSTSGQDKFQKLLNAQTFSDLQSDPVGKASTPDVTKKEATEHRVTVNCLANGDDPFVCPPRPTTQQWRSQLRSSSHDMSMPDYTSYETDNSGACTEMSGVSFPRANFLKHMNEANPREIVQALSPARQEELLRVLSASQSPVQDRGTHPPTNTPHSLSGQSRPASSNGRARDQKGNRLNVHEIVSRLDDSSDSSGSRAFQELPRRRRTCSEGSRKNGTELGTNNQEDHSSAALPWERRAKDEIGLPPTSARSVSQSTNRQRSASNGSKRKRESGSPSVGTAKAADTVQVIVDSSSSPGEGQEMRAQLQLALFADDGGALLG